MRIVRVAYLIFCVLCTMCSLTMFGQFCKRQKLKDSAELLNAKLRQRLVTIIGHRGACGYVAENTCASVDKAIDCKADVVEFDARVCASGEPVIMHDDTVDRTTDGSGAVAELSLTQLGNLSIRDSHEKVPTLLDMLLHIDRRICANIELKSEDADNVTAYILGRLVEYHDWHQDDFIVSSFDHEQLNRFHFLLPQVPIGVLEKADAARALNVACKLDAAAVIVAYKLLTPELVDSTHLLGKALWTFTLNSSEQVKRAFEIGVDGIVTDYPDLVCSVLADCSS